MQILWALVTGLAMGLAVLIILGEWRAQIRARRHETQVVRRFVPR